MGDFFKVLGSAAFASSDVPTGLILYSPSSSIGGYLLCDGSAVSRSLYVDLFTLIGTTYGSGDGSTTFNLPDLRDTLLQGAATTSESLDTSSGGVSVTLTKDNWPSHTHTLNLATHSHYLQPIKRSNAYEFWMFNDEHFQENNYWMANTKWNTICQVASGWNENNQLVSNSTALSPNVSIPYWGGVPASGTKPGFICSSARYNWGIDGANVYQRSVDNGNVAVTVSDVSGMTQGVVTGSSFVKSILPSYCELYVHVKY